MPIRISDSEKKYLLQLTPNDITFELLLDLFADTVDVKNNYKVKPCRMNPSDEFTLTKDEYFNTETVVTTAGIFIYNKLLIERDFKTVVGYMNDTINGNVLSDIESKLSNALLNSQINEWQKARYLDLTQWLSMQLHAVICGSFTMKTLKPLPMVTKERDRLLKENAEKIEQGDVITAAKIEKQLLKLADEQLGDDPGLDLYRSGARGSFGNNFKNISVMKGPVYNPTTGKFDIVKSNFMEGIRKEDIPVLGNSVVTGAFPKAIGTATSGYFSKQIIAALQSVVLDQPGSDCGTKGTLNVKLTSGLKKDYMYRYIVEGGKMVLLDEKNIDSYMGKTVKMRSPMYCTSKKLCRGCAGLMYERLNIEKIGLTAARVSSTLLNLSMKKFHDSSAKLHQVKPTDMII